MYSETLIKGIGGCTTREIAPRMGLSRTYLGSRGSSSYRSLKGAARILLLWIISLGFVAAHSPIFNVMNYGAIGNGYRDDSEAFLKAWGAACTNSGSPIFLVPSNKTFLLGEITFHGPCHSSIHVQVSGDIVAPNKLWTNKVLVSLLTFINIDGITMDGAGQIDGKGPIWWDCLAKKQCKVGPRTLAFYACKDLRLNDIKIRDSPGKQLTVFQSVGVRISGLTITAPQDSPNTDGILITASQHVEIVSSTIGTGDDCISVGPGSSDVNISSITCSPSHGISIGSLGKHRTTSIVQQIRVSHCNISHSMFGVRIKTWQGGSGYAKDIQFEKINFNSVKTPIVIDQYYCPEGRGHCPNATSAVALSDLRFIGLRGSSSLKEAIWIACSQNVPCKGVILEDISLSLEGPNGPAESYCCNAHGSTIGRVVPEVPCLGKYIHQ